MTQHQLLLEYIRENGFIIPAKMDGKRAFKGEYIGSQADKRCRELRAAGKLISEKDGKFEVFRLRDNAAEKVKLWANSFKEPIEQISQQTLI